MGSKQTRNNKRLTSHYENHMHRPKLLQAHLLPAVNCYPQHPHKYHAEPANTDRRCDIACALQPVDIGECRRHSQNISHILHAQREPEAKSQKYDDGREAKDDAPIEGQDHTRAESADLQAERDFDGYEQKNVHDCRDDLICVIRVRDTGIVPCQEGIRFGKVSRKEEALEKQADHVKCK